MCFPVDWHSALQDDRGLPPGNLLASHLPASLKLNLKAGRAVAVHLDEGKSAGEPYSGL